MINEREQVDMIIWSILRMIKHLDKLPLMLQMLSSTTI